MAVLTYHGGPIIKNPRVFNLYLGNWSSRIATEKIQILNSFMTDLVVSKYMNVLSQYGCGTSGSFVTSVNVPTIEKTLNTPLVESILLQAFSSNLVEGPVHANNIYILYMAEDMEFIEGENRMCALTNNNWYGFHNSIRTSQHPGLANNVVYALISSMLDRCIRPSEKAFHALHIFQRLTATVSHEFAEMITDPVPFTGWDEIGDPCMGMAGHITVGSNRWTVQKIYSVTQAINTNGLNHCVVANDHPLPEIDRNHSIDVTGNPVLVQGTGAKVHFLELIAITQDSKLLRLEYLINNPAGWKLVSSIDIPVHAEVVSSMINSDYGSEGHLEVILRIDNLLYLYISPFGGSENTTWQATGGPLRADGHIINFVRGNPAFIQNKIPGLTHQDFEMIVPKLDGGIRHYTRNSSGNWTTKELIGYYSHVITPQEILNSFPNLPTPPRIMHYNYVTMIQSDFGTLEVIARSGSQLFSFFFDRNQNKWGDPGIIKIGDNAINDAAGNPVLIQSNFGSGAHKNFELIVPASAGGLKHYVRDNSNNDMKWSHAGTFAEDHHIDYVTFIQNQLNNNFEVVVRRANRMYSFFRDSSFNWHGGDEVKVLPPIV